VLVDGLDFSEDKMLIGRTFSYSDTQRYRVGPNYLQLPVNRPKNAKVSTNQQGGQMQYGVDNNGANPHVNYEPSITGGLREAAAPTADEYGPEFKDDLVENFVTNISEATREVQERMVWHFLMCDDELGLRVGEGLGISSDDVRHLEPLKSQTLSDEEEQRRANLGKNGPRDVDGLKMTHCVPNEHVVIGR
jgi:catalase